MLQKISNRRTFSTTVHKQDFHCSVWCKRAISVSWIFHFSSPFPNISISLTVSRRKNEWGTLAALQLAPSNLIILHPIFSFHKHWPKSSETDMWIQPVEHKQFHEESFSRQFYLHRVASCFAASSVSCMYPPFRCQKRVRLWPCVIKLAYPEPKLFHTQSLISNLDYTTHQCNKTWHFQ